MTRQLFWFALMAISFPAHSGDKFSGRVVRIADGDTLTLLADDNTQHKIRIGGIDAPERRQSFGQRSKENLARLAFSKSAEASCQKRDRYRREVCNVQVDGRDVGFEQLSAGLAWWYRKYAGEQSALQRHQYETAEASAREKRIGLWIEADPVAPWNFRHPSRADLAE